MLNDPQPEETKHCRIIKTQGACGPEEILLTNKLRIFDIKKKKMMSHFLPSLVKVLYWLFPHNPVQRVDPSFPQVIPKYILSHTKCVSLDAPHFTICSIPTLIQLPPGWHSPKSCSRRWARQPGAQLGASHWEPANIALNPPFLLCSRIPTATETTINYALSPNPLISK